MQIIPFTHLAYSILPLFIVWYYYKKWTNDKYEIITSTIRMVVQLLVIGYFLIYLFKEKNDFVGLSIIIFMITVSTWIALRNTQDRSINHYSKILISIAISGIIHLILIIAFVLDLHTLYEPRYVIPIAGMIFANTMIALSVAVERYEKEISRDVPFEKAREVAFKACLIPQINSLLAVGLVSLPGMMTGQILSGIDPLIAVRYQIMIMTMILSSAGISAIIYFSLKKSKA